MFGTRLDKYMYMLLIAFMFAIGAGGAYLRYVQERIIETQVLRAEQINKLIETQKIRENQIAQVIETQQTRAQQISELEKAILKLDGANDEFRKDMSDFKVSLALQDKKLDEILGVIKRQRQ